MYNRNYTRIFISLVLALFLLSGVSATAASIKDRMVTRIPAINAMKDKGLIGENNQGYLEFRSNNRPDKKTVQNENKDRKTVYKAIAKKEDANSALVGQRRAKQIAQKGSSGHFFQNSDGGWYKKK